MIIKIPKFWSIFFRNLAKNTTKFPAAFGGQIGAKQGEVFIKGVLIRNPCDRLTSDVDPGR